MLKDFKDVEGDRKQGVRTLPVVVGLRAAVLLNMVAVSGGYALALALLIQHIGIQHGALVPLLGLALTNLLVLGKLLRDPGPVYARKAYRLALTIFMGVTILYVGVQASYQR